MDEKEILRDILRKIRLLSFKEGFDYITGDVESYGKHKKEIHALYTEFCEKLGVSEK